MLKTKMDDLINDIDVLMLCGVCQDGSVTSKRFVRALYDLKLEILSDFRGGYDIDLFDRSRLLNSLCSCYGVCR